MDLTDDQWAIIGPLLPKPRVRKDGRGRPWKDEVDPILRTGAPWHDLPDRYPLYQTCHRRFQQWVRSCAFEKVLKALAKDLEERGKIGLTEAFIDGTFAGAKKGAGASGKPSAGRAQRSWRSQTAMVFLSLFAQTLLRRTK